MGQVGGEGAGAAVDRPVAAQHQVGAAEGHEGGDQGPGQAALVLAQLAQVAVPVALVAERDPDDVHAEGGDVAQDGLDRRGSGADGHHPTGPGLRQPQGVLECGGVGRRQPDAEPVTGDGAVEGVDVRSQVADAQAGHDERAAGGRDRGRCRGRRHPWWKTTPWPPSG